MAVTHTQQTLPLGAVTLHRIGAALNAFVARYDAWIEAKRSVEALRRLSAHQLDDIGLTVGDVEDYARKLTF